MSALARSRRLLLAVTLIAAFACDSQDDTPLFGAPPVASPLRLVTIAGAISPAAARDGQRDSGIVASWRGDALGEWNREQSDGDVRYTSPSLGAEGLPDAGRLRLRLRPGGANRVAVVPHLRGSQETREHRVLRRIVLPLAQDADPAIAVDLEVDLLEALHGNFGDAGRGGRLEKLEIELPGARLRDAALVDVAITRHQTVPSEEAAGAMMIEHGGVLRPSWFVRGGAAAELAITVPTGSPELRWHDAALPGTGSRIVEVLEDSGDETVLFADPPTGDGALGAPWRLQARSLGRWAGRAIRLRCRVDGPGVGLFGNPRITQALAPRAPDVLVYLIDTLRADRLGAGGSPLPGVSPTIDRLAREGAWLELALSSSPWTKPAIATLMSGILPTTHGVGAATYTDRMPATVALVQERFLEAGWRTGSFSASPLGSTLSALERGFEATHPPRYWKSEPRLDKNPSAGQLSEALLAWVDEEPDQPFFAYVHTLEVHEWKLPRYQRDLPHGFTAYDAAILDADRHLGRLLEDLAARGRADDLLVVVVSDHGESWGDHGLPSHGFGLFQSQIHIPMIFWQRGARFSSRVRSPASLADLAPTLLEGFGLAPLEEADGRSQTGALRGHESADRTIFSALLRFVWAPNAPRQYAITTPSREKLIRAENGAPRVFDLVVDPREVHPASPPDPELVRELERILAEQRGRAAAFRKRHGRPTSGTVSSDDVERLRALGYLAPPAAPPSETR